MRRVRYNRLASVRYFRQLDIERMIARYPFCEALGLVTELCRDFSPLALSEEELPPLGNSGRNLTFDPLVGFSPEYNTAEEIGRYMCASGEELEGKIEASLIPSPC